MGRVEEAARRAGAAGGLRSFADSGAIDEAAGAFVDAAAPVEELVEAAPVARGDSSTAPAALPGDASRPRHRLLPVRERLQSALTQKVVVDPAMKPASREQYRRLAATLHQLQASRGLKVVMLTSATAGEGKTLTAANLAMTLSESYQKRVLLVDADLRRPSLHTMFQLDNTIGLSEGLAAPEDQRLAVHDVSSTLTVLTAGTPTGDPMGLLTSERMRLFIEEARTAFDWVIVDTPPVGLLTDASLLVANADGAVFVIRAEQTPYSQVLRAIEEVGRDSIVGIVLNRVAPDGGAHHYDYSRYYYASAPSASA